MRRATRAIVALVIAATTAVGTLPGQAATGKGYDRLYLLSADTGYKHWGVDPADPEMDGGTIFTRGGAGIPSATGDRLFSIYFMPGSLVDEPVAWNAAAPLRYRLALTVTSAAAYTVQVVHQRGTSITLSDTASQVAPGIWEGIFRGPDAIGTGGVDLFGVRVTTKAPTVDLLLRTDGASWLELPRTFAARGVPSLLAATPAATVSYTTPLRSYAFNDDQWSVATFTGDLTATRTFSVPVPRDTAFVYAWVEVDDAPVLYDAGRGRVPSPSAVTDRMNLSLRRDGQLLDSGGSASTVTELRVEAGSPVDVQVSPTATSRGVPYRVYVLQVYGERTLASFRIRLNRYYISQAHRTPMTASCPANSEPVPTTAAVTTFLTHLNWDSDEPLDAWTLAFDVPEVGSFPCGEAGAGNEVRMTIPRDNVWLFGPTPAPGTAFASVQDTVFEFSVRLSYSPVA